MKNFKNTFGVRSNSTPLLKAFMEAAKHLGWTYQGLRELEESHQGLWFNSAPGSPLKDDHFWICDTITGTAPEPIYTLPQQWDEALAAASEKNTPKEGDWVVVLPTDKFYYNALHGRAQLVDALRPTEPLPYKLAFPGGGTNSYKEVRFATKEEIESERVRETTVHISSKTRGVLVKRNGEIHAGGETFQIGLIKELHRKLTNLSVVGSPWSIKVESVQVGCTSGITLQDLSNIIEAYERIKY